MTVPSLQVSMRVIVLTWMITTACLVTVARGSPEPYCGIYAAAMAAARYEKHVDFSELLSQEFVDMSSGSSLAGLQAAVAHTGLHTAALRGVHPYGLRGVGDMAILHVRSNVRSDKPDHWVLMTHADAGGVQAMYLPGEPRSYAWHEMQYLWDGTLLLVSDRPVGRVDVWKVQGAQVFFGGWMFVITLAVIVMVVLLARHVNVLQPQGRLKNLALQSVILVMLVGTVAALGLVGLTPQRALTDENALADLSSAHRVNLLPRVSYTAVRTAAAGKENVVVIDVRSESEFAAGHIPGAMNIPYNLMWVEVEAALSEVSEDTPLVLYCSGPRCDFSRRLADRLLDHGLHHVRLYPGGWDEWSRKTH